MVGTLGAAADRDPQSVDEVAGDLLADGDVPAADEERSDRGDVRVESRLQDEGKEAFNKSWEELLKSIESQSGVTAS